MILTAIVKPQRELALTEVRASRPRDKGMRRLLVEEPRAKEAELICKRTVFSKWPPPQGVSVKDRKLESPAWTNGGSPSRGTERVTQMQSRLQFPLQPCSPSRAAQNESQLVSINELAILQHPREERKE